MCSASSRAVFARSVIPRMAGTETDREQLAWVGVELVDRRADLLFGRVVVGTRGATRARGLGVVGTRGTAVRSRFVGRVGVGIRAH